MALRKDSKNQALRNAAIAFLAIFLLSGALLILKLWENQRDSYPSDGAVGLSPVFTYQDKEYERKEDVHTVLVLGLDKFEEVLGNDAYNNDRQADFLMLLVIDDRNETCTALHINRDTMADINILGVAGERVGTINKQIALAHTYGNGKEVSCGNVADAVSNLFYNVKIDHFISVTMDAVPLFNDLVGGVEVEVLDDFTGVDDTLIQGERVTLTGRQALNYIRSRKGLEDSSNGTRMVRQRQYLDALYRKAMACADNDPDFVVEASVTIADYLVSDCSVNQLQTLFHKLSDYGFDGIRTVEGDTVTGEKYVEFYPDVDSMKRTVVELFYQEKGN